MAEEITAADIDAMGIKCNSLEKTGVTSAVNAHFMV